MRVEFMDAGRAFSFRPLNIKKLTGKWRIVIRSGDYRYLEIEQWTLFGTRWISEHDIYVYEYHEFKCDEMEAA